MEDTMRRIDTLSSELSNSQTELINKLQEVISLSGQASTSSTGIRSYFEAQGKTVDWNDDTKQFSVNGNWFDSSGYDFVDVYEDGKIGQRLYATYEELLKLEEQLKNLPSYASGGYIRKDQLAMIHKDERVLTPEQNKEYEASALSPVAKSKFDSSVLKPIDIYDLPIFSGMSREQVDNGLKNLTTSMPIINPIQESFTNMANQLMDSLKLVNATPSVVIENIDAHSEFTGITSEQFARDQEQFGKSIIKKEEEQVSHKMKQSFTIGGAAPFSVK
jgi:hypothetical protein